MASRGAGDPLCLKHMGSLQWHQSTGQAFIIRFDRHVVAEMQVWVFCSKGLGVGCWTKWSDTLAPEHTVKPFKVFCCTEEQAAPPGLCHIDTDGLDLCRDGLQHVFLGILGHLSEISKYPTSYTEANG
eukprot:925059-Amphidinium_carterae.2